eukprot:617123-Pleurochrysis_carterae.AAC.1
MPFDENLSSINPYVQPLLCLRETSKRDMPFVARPKCSYEGSQSTILPDCHRARSHLCSLGSESS